MFARCFDSIRQARRSAAAGTSRRLAPLSVLALVLALAVAGCGAAGTVGASGGSGAPGGGAASSTPTPKASVNPGGPNKTSVRPCLGPFGSVSDVRPQPAVVLTPATPPDHTATAHIGDVIQVRLPTTRSWRYLNNTSDSSGAVALLQPAGVQDGTLGVCVWNFKALSAGTAALSFAGAPLCDQPGAVCPQNILALDFTITVS